MGEPSVILSLVALEPEPTYEVRTGGPGPEETVIAFQSRLGPLPDDRALNPLRPRPAGQRHDRQPDRRMRYWVESDELWCATDTEPGWHGRPDGHPVVFAALVPGTNDAVVLLDAESGPRDSLGRVRGWPHLVRVRPDGTVVWRAAAGLSPSDHDWWVAVDVTDGVVASTWSGYRRRLDWEDGHVLSSVFVK